MWPEMAWGDLDARSYGFTGSRCCICMNQGNLRLIDLNQCLNVELRRPAWM
jgi:hypothetical protein